MILENKFGNIKVATKYLKDFVDGKFEKMSIHLAYGCSELYSTVVNTQASEPNCSFTTNSNYFRLSLEGAKNKTNHINKINFKNLETGAIYTKDIDVSFDHYIATCPTGCLLDTFSPHYDNIFETIIQEIMVENNLDDNSFSIDICGDELLLKELPENVIPYSVEYDNGQVDYFQYYNSTKYVISGNNLYLTPQIINMPSFTDGIYGVRIRFYLPDGSWVESQQCFFNDVTTKCKVAKYMKELLGGEVKTSERVHILHYSLVNASNCGDCNCENMCKMYNQVQSILSNNPNITNEEDCGCGT